MSAATVHGQGALVACGVRCTCGRAFATARGFTAHLRSAARRGERVPGPYGAPPAYPATVAGLANLAAGLGAEIVAHAHHRVSVPADPAGNVSPEHRDIDGTRDGVVAWRLVRGVEYRVTAADQRAHERVARALASSLPDAGACVVRCGWATFVRVVTGPRLDLQG